MSRNGIPLSYTLRDNVIRKSSPDPYKTHLVEPSRTEPLRTKQNYIGHICKK